MPHDDLGLVKNVGIGCLIWNCGGEAAQLLRKVVKLTMPEQFFGSDVNLNFHG